MIEFDEICRLITERNGGEVLPHDSRDWLETLFQKASIGIVQGDVIGRFLRVNARFAEIVGRPVESLIGQFMQNFTHPADLHKNVQQRKKMIKTGKPFEIGKRYLRPDGTVIWVKNHVSLVCDQAGRPQYTLAFVHDITEQKLIEESLRESEDHYRHAVELNPQIFWTTDSDGNLLEINSRGLALLGLSYEDAKGGGWAKAMHPDDAIRAKNARAYSLRGSEPFDVEYRLRCYDGNYRWVRSRANPRRGTRGEVIRWYGASEDIHDRKVAEEKLRESEEFVRSILESIPDRVKVLNLQGQVLFMNKPGLSLLEIDDGETINGKHWELLWPAEERAKLRVALEGARTGRNERFVAFSPTSTGEPKWWDVSISAIRGSDGQPVRLLVISRDITASKLAREEIEASTSRLSRMLESTTDNVILLDRECRITYMNRHVRNLFGIQHDYRGASLPDAFQAVTGTVFERQFRHAVKRQIAVTFEAFWSPLKSWLAALCGRPRK
jgi:PAS domain S-box-containing protein